jgi:hypothetical protein
LKNKKGDVNSRHGFAEEQFAPETDDFKNMAMVTIKARSARDHP